MKIKTGIILGLCFAGASAQASLVGLWSADGNTVDSIFGNDGVIVGTVGYTQGVTGQAFAFSGNGHIRVPSASAYDFGTGDFSVALWVRFDSMVTNATGIMSRDDWPGESNYKGWVMNNDSGNVGIVTRTASSGSASARISGSNFTLGDWYHLAGVRSAGTTKLFLNGSLVASASEGSGFNLSNAAPLTIGAVNDGFQRMSGAIDDVRLYDHALSDTEIGLLANPVPEPATLAVIGLGLAGFASRRKKK